jgi:hypothetical protein
VVKKLLLDFDNYRAKMEAGYILSGGKYGDDPFVNIEAEAKQLLGVDNNKEKKR